MLGIPVIPAFSRYFLTKFDHCLKSGYEVSFFVMINLAKSDVGKWAAKMALVIPLSTLLVLMAAWLYIHVGEWLVHLGVTWQLAIIISGAIAALIFYRLIVFFDRLVFPGNNKKSNYVVSPQPTVIPSLVEVVADRPTTPLYQPPRQSSRKN